MTETTSPKLPAAPPAPRPEHIYHLDLRLPSLLKGTAFFVIFVGVLAGFSMLVGIGTGSPIPGFSVIIASLWSAVWIYAFGDIVLSLRKIASNSAK